jgi:chromosome condensin MukBEF ATPase and DNA-binding subunit MukB
VLRQRSSLPENAVTEQQLQLASMLELARTSSSKENLETAFQAHERFMLGTATADGQDQLLDRLQQKRQEIEARLQRQDELKKQASKDNEHIDQFHS